MANPLYYGDAAARQLAHYISGPVADETALAAIPARYRIDGMIIALGNQTIWQWIDDDVQAASPGTVVYPDDAPTTGNWLVFASAATALATTPIQKRTVTVGHADLTDAVNGEAQAINIGATLPANARIVGVDMRALTAFSGGSASAVTCDVGTSGDIDALIDGADLFAAAVDGGPATMPKGVRPNKTFVSAGAQLIATFAPDAGHTLLGLTAGSVVIDVLFTAVA